MKFEQFKKMFDESFGKVTATDFVKQMELLGYVFQDSLPLIPKFWFMRDNHTFIPLQGKNLHQIANHAILCAKEHPYGMICPVTIIQGDKEIKSVGSSVHVPPNGEVDLTKWLEEIQQENCIKNYKHE